MKKILAISIFLFVSTTQLNAQDINAVPQLENGSSLILSGLGMYQDFGEDLYLGAIYVKEGAYGIEPGASMRMEMRIASERLNARKFVRIWMDAISLNSTRASRNELSEQIQVLGSLFQENFLRGDRIQFDFIAGEGIRFYVNQNRVGEISGEEFYSLLLNCWIGNAPPSVQFKNGMLDLAEPETRSVLELQLAGLTYSTARIAEIEQMRITREAATETARLAEIERQQEIEQLALAEAAEAERIRLETDAAEIARVENERLQALELEQEQVRQQEEEAARIIAEREQIAHAAEQVTIREAYRIQLRRWISANVEYPQRALERGIEGDILILVVSSRQGDVLSANIETSSGFAILDDGALKAIDKSIPFPEMPADLDGDEFSLNMPLSYKLN